MKHHGFGTLSLDALASVTGAQTSSMPPASPRLDFEVMSSNGLARAIYRNGEYVRTEVVR